MTLTVNESDLGPLQPLGKHGNQAILYKVPKYSLPSESGPLIYKQYRDKILQSRGMAIKHGMQPLIALPGRLESNKKRILFARTTWPRAMVLRGDVATGLIMKALPPVFYFDLRFPTRTKREDLKILQFLRPDKDQKKYGIPEHSPKQLARLVARLSLALSMLHDLQVIVGDFSPNNIVVSNPNLHNGELEPKFLDVDSFRIAGSVPPISQGSTPGWFAPEVVKAAQEACELERDGASIDKVAKARGKSQVRNTKTDVFKFGLLSMRLFHDDDNRLNAYAPSQATIRRMNTVFGTHRVSVLLSCLEVEPSKRPTMDDIRCLFVR